MLFYKFVFWIAVLVIAMNSTYDAYLHEAAARHQNFPWPRGSDISVWSRLATWDAGAYLLIARDGYTPHSPLCAYFPLFPAVITPFHAFAGERTALVSALIINNVVSICGGLFVFRIAARRFDEKIAARSVVLLFLNPGAIYFSLAYTESIFLFLIALTFDSLDTGRLNAAAASSFLLPLTRAIGIFILIPILMYCWLARGWRAYFKLIVPTCLGYLTYLWIMHRHGGSLWAGYLAQADYLNSPSVAKILDLAGFLAAVPLVIDFCHPTAGLLDRLLFLAFLVGMLLSRRLDRTMWAFCLFIGIVPALSNVFLSYTRFFAVCFPLFIGVASTSRGPVRNQYYRIGIFLGGAAQMYCLGRVLSFKWVG